MSKAGEISGKITSINDYSNNRNFYMPVYSQRKPKTIPSRIRKGEIVSGTIMTNAHNSIATVRLPVGTLDAKLHNRLKKGDVLFFIVSEEKPVLTLKVYSVNTVINGKRLNNSEILRILDIDEDFLSNTILDAMRQMNKTIQKDNFLNIMNDFHYLPDSFLEGKNIKSVLNTIYWINEANIEYNYENVGLFYYLFNGLTYFENLIDQLSELIQVKISTVTKHTQQILDLINSEYQFSFLSAFYSKNANTNYLLYNNLKEILFQFDSKQTIHKTAQNIINVIDGIHKWNTVAEIKPVPYHLYMPIPFADSDNIHAHLIIQNYKSSNLKSVIKIEKDDPDNDIGARLLHYESLAFTIELFAKKDIETQIKDLALKTRNELLNYNLSLQAFIVNYNNEEKDFLPDFPKSPAKKISVVI